MASVYQQNGKGPYWARVKLYNVQLDDYKWDRLATGVYEEGAAYAIAVKLERASEDAARGHMTRQKAELLVQHILDLAGVNVQIAAPTFLAFGDEFFQGREENIAEATNRKYTAHWTRVKRWAGEKMNLRMDQWDAELLTAYYQDLLGELSVTTTNDHMRTLSMLFIRAKNRGFIEGNPAMSVEKKANDSTDRLPITRDDQIKIAGHFRNLPELEWFVLASLGWHTGHRIEDLQQLGEKNVHQAKGVGAVVTFQPIKKRNQDGAREVTLPIPSWLAKQLKRVDLPGLGDNRNGSVSTGFIARMETAGVVVPRVEKKKRIVPLKSFHGYRHSMASRLTAAGVDDALAGLVTDHENEQVRKRYTHAEVKSIAEALKKARRR